MILGIEPVEIGLFLGQLGLVTAGASALWGIALRLAANRSKDTERKKVFTKLSEKLLLPLTLGVALAVLARLALLVLEPSAASAHEGIVLDVEAPHAEARPDALHATLFVLLAVASAGFWLVFRKSAAVARRYLGAFYALVLAATAILISTPVWTGAIFDGEQLFFIGHNFHSILTLGTVIVLDFLFFASESSLRVKRHFYPFLPNISKTIWVGLGIEFVSVLFVLEDALALTPKFFFMQTLIGVIIVNGAFLSGPMNRGLIASVKGSGDGMLSRRWTRAEGISGVISISSWSTITFLDFLRHITWSYAGFALFYACVLIAAYASYRLIERRRPRL